MPVRKRLWPVIDPGVPARDRDRLTDPGTKVVPATSPPPPRRAGWGPARAGRGFMGQLSVWFIIGLAAFGIGAKFHPWAATALAAVVVAIVIAGWVLEIPSERAARVHHRRYLLSDDLDAQAQAQLSRASAAIDQVRASTVYELGFLDRIDNDLVLPHRLWVLAETLAAQTRLRAHQRDAAPAPDAVLEPQREALARSIADVERQVTALEHYAERVAAADRAHTEQLKIREALDHNDDYRRLMSGIGADDPVAELTATADRVETALRSTLHDAVTAGETLAVPPERDQ